MKILIVIDQLEVGGAERVCVDHANILAAKGHIVTVLSILGKGPLSADLDKCIEQIELKRINKFSVWKMLAFSNYCNQFDIIHIHHRYILRYAIVANLIKKIKTKIVFHDHFGSIDIDKSDDWLIAHTKLPFQYIGVSKELCDWATQLLMLNPDRVHLLPNIIVKQKALPNTAQKNGIRFILTSNFRSVKNIEFSIDIIQQLHTQSINCQLDIYGGNVEIEYRKKIDDRINQLGLSNDIKIIEGVSNIQPVLGHYTLALHTSKSETGPLVLIEYLAQGLPFLAYHTGEVATRLSSELNDFFIHAFDMDEWLKQITNIINTPRYVWKGKMDALFHTLYDVEDYYAQCIKIYEAALRS